MATDRFALLRSFLGALPPSVAARLANTLEADRLNDGQTLANGQGLPHDLILDNLRPVLRKADKTERTLTPLRAFSRPFEDLLTDNPRTQKQKGRIPRASVTPIWNWLSQTLIPDALAAYSIAAKTAVLGYRADEMRAKTAEFWTTASHAIRGALDMQTGRRVAQVTLGSSALAEDAREMALMLAAGSDVAELQDALPDAIPSLTDEIVSIFSGVYQRLANSMPQAASYLPLVVMRRLERPWEVLRLPLSIQSHAEAAATTSGDIGLAGELLVADLEACGTAIRQTQPHQFHADALVAHLAHFCELSSGLALEFERRQDGKWAERLLKDRAAVSEVMEALMERAPKAIAAALPMVDSDGGAAKAPDLAGPADPERSDRALSYARLVAGCRRLAEAASFAGALKAADEEIGAALKSYNDGIVRELRSSDDEKKAHAGQYFAVAIELTSILFTAQEGEFLHRRGRAVATQAAAA